MRLTVLVLLAGVSAAQAQVAEQIPSQEAGATDWFGEHVLRVRGPSRVEIEPANAGHVAILQMLPSGMLLVRHLDTLLVRRQSFQVEGLMRGGEIVRVPFTVSCSGPPPCPRMPPSIPPASARPPRDAILVLLTDVALDSAELVDRLGRLPPLAPDSVAENVGRLLVARHTAMWAAYYQVR